MTGGQARVSVGGVDTFLPARGVAPGPARLAVRPGAFRLSGDGQGLEGRVATAAYLGDHIEYEIETAAGPLFVIDDTSSAAVAPGSGIRLQFRGVGVALIA